MNVYVDEIPKTCQDCPCLNRDYEYGEHCNLGVFDANFRFYEYEYIKSLTDFKEVRLCNRHPDCPLKLLDKEKTL